MEHLKIDAYSQRKRIQQGSEGKNKKQLRLEEHLRFYWGNIMDEKYRNKLLAPEKDKEVIQITFIYERKILK